MGAPAAGEMLSDADRLALLDELEESGLGWFWSSDEEGRLSYLSPAIFARMGVPAERLIGRPLAEVFTVVGNEERQQALTLRLGARKPFSALPVSPEGGDGEGLVIRLSGRPIYDRSGNFRGYRGTGNDVTEEHHRERETARLARFDSLTGLLNRHRMAYIIENTVRTFCASKRNCAVMMLDLDRFKQVNDTLGHAAGDELLRQVAARLQRSVDRPCEIGRLGGDEFQLLIPDLDDRGTLGEIAGKIIAMLTQPYSLEEGRCVIGASVGIAIAPHDGVSGKEVVKAADMALYAAKNGGRGQFRFYSVDLENEAIFRKRLENGLSEALSDSQLFLCFQPVVSGKSLEVVSLEAMIGWNHPQRGKIDPEEFAAIAENSSLLPEIGQWAIRTACRHAREWPGSLRVAVNIPTPFFFSADFTAIVRAAIEETGVDPARVELEVRESVFLGDQGTVDKVLGQLFKLGVRLTLDEFGTGFSSLDYLRRAPFDTIKFGDSFLAGALEEESRDLALVKALVALASAMGMGTIAAGIETHALMDALQQSGVSALQGPIFTDPVSPEEALRELENGSWLIRPSPDREYRARRRTVLRRIHVIHDDHSYAVMLRNLSRSGALIQGLLDVPVGTQFVVDLGGGQLAVAEVIRSSGDTQGIEFETPLVDDGAGGLCTRYRVSPYDLAAAGAPLEALSGEDYKSMRGGVLGAGPSILRFAYAPGFSPEPGAADRR